MFEDVGFILNFLMGSRFIHDTIIRTFSKKIDAFICSMNMLSPEVVLYLYKGTIVLSRKFCIHGWDGTSNSFLNMIKLQSNYIGQLVLNDLLLLKLWLLIKIGSVFFCLIDNAQFN